MIEEQKQIPQSHTEIHHTSDLVTSYAHHTSEILQESQYGFEEFTDPNEHPAHFLHLYDGDELLWYLQFGYFAPNGHKPFYFIAHLENISSSKGIGKRLMYEFLSQHSRVFLDDNACMDGIEAKWYYQQFWFRQLATTNLWYMGFDEDEKNSLPLLYTRTVFGEIRKELQRNG